MKTKEYIIEKLNKSLPEDIFVQYAEKESVILSIFLKDDNICFEKHKIELKGKNYLQPKKDRLSELLEERYMLVSSDIYEDINLSTEKELNSYLRKQLYDLGYDKEYVDKEINKLTRECKKAKKEDITFIIDGKEFKDYSEVSNFKFLFMNEAVYTIEDQELLEKFNLKCWDMMAHLEK